MVRCVEIKFCKVCAHLCMVAYSNQVTALHISVVKVCICINL